MYCDIIMVQDKLELIEYIGGRIWVHILAQQNF